jgi:hypothetical protein
MIRPIRQKSYIEIFLRIILGITGIYLSIKLFNYSMIYPSNLYILNNNKIASDYSLIYTMFSLILFFISITITSLIPKKESSMLALLSILILVTVILNLFYQKTDKYLTDKQEYFINNTTNFMKKYPHTDEVKELMAYVNKKDFKSLEKMNPNTFVYTDIIDLASKIKTLNDTEVTELYRHYMKDGEINLIEKKDLESLIIKKINERL